MDDLTKRGMTADECLAIIEKDRAELREEVSRLQALLGEAMNPPAPADMRADYLAAWLWLTEAGVPVLVDGKPATLAERVKLLVAGRDEAQRTASIEGEQRRLAAEETCRAVEERNAASARCDAAVGDAIAREQRLLSERNAARAMHETATQNAANAKARAEYVMKQRDQFAAAIDRMEPLRTVLRSWDWKTIAEDGALPRHDVLCEARVIEAFAAVERAENEAKEAEHVRDR